MSSKTEKKRKQSNSVISAPSCSIAQSAGRWINFRNLFFPRSFDHKRHHGYAALHIRRIQTNVTAIEFCAVVANGISDCRAYFMNPSRNPQDPSRIFDVVFLFSYLANVFLMVAISLLFRYSDFIESLGGNEWHLGWIVGLGTTGAILFRVVQGAAIDRFGALWVWTLSLTGFAASSVWHLRIDDPSSFEVFAARMLMNTCIAGVFGSWLSFVTLRVKEHKVAEVVGVVGSSGFLGMAIGPMIGDWIYSGADSIHKHVDQMFIVAAGLVVCSLLCACTAGILAHRMNERRIQLARLAQSDTTMWQLLRQYHPGFLLLIAGVMGLAISLPGNFLRPFAQTRDIEQIKIFFLTYNVVAFISRLTFRKAPEVLGLRTTILLGLGFMSLSMILYLLVESKWGLMFPAIAGGLAHSFLFPSVVAGATTVFPKQNRGTATSLILAMYDVGVLVGSPIVGLTLTGTRMVGWPDYPIMFCLVSAALVIVALCFLKIYAPARGTQLVKRVAT